MLFCVWGWCKGNRIAGESVCFAGGEIRILTDQIGYHRSYIQTGRHYRPACYGHCPVSVKSVGGTGARGVSGGGEHHRRIPNPYQQGSG